MKLPNKIEVLNRTYKVVEKDMGEGSHIGRGNFMRGVIQIEKSLDPQAKADTFLHEIIHLILIAMGHEFDDKSTLHTEENVLIISNGLSTFLRDNGEMFKELIDSLE
jgi:hypothetical protein